MSAPSSPAVTDPSPELPAWLADAVDPSLRHDHLHLVLLQRVLADVMNLRLKLANEARVFQSTARVAQAAADDLREEVAEARDVATPLTDAQHEKLCALVSGNLAEFAGAMP